jgi:hypothetical protein
VGKEVSEIVSKAKLVEEIMERKVVFSGITSGVDMAYRLDEGGVEQQIVIGSAESMKNEFTFGLSAPSLTYKDIGNGVWYFFDASGSAVFRLPKGWATDGNNAFTNDVTQQIREVNGKLQLILTVPLSWLTAKERVYPIVVHSALEVIPEKRVGSTGNIPHVSVPEKQILVTPSPTIVIPSLSPEPVVTDSAVITTPIAEPTLVPAIEASDSAVATDEGTAQ